MPHITIRKISEFRKVFTLEVTMPYYMWLPFSDCIDSLIVPEPEGLVRQGVFFLSDILKEKMEKDQRFTEDDFDLMLHDHTQEYLLNELNFYADRYRKTGSEENRNADLSVLLSLIPANFLCTRKIIIRPSYIRSLECKRPYDDSDWRYMCRQLELVMNENTEKDVKTHE